MTAPLMDANEILDTLLMAYGPQRWWPGDTPLEIMVGAVLTQNTAWRNVARAIANLKHDNLLSLDALLEARPDEVRAAIRPAGFQNVKYARLLALLRFVADTGGLESLTALPVAGLRPALLKVHGIGPETADSILLYALGRAVVVVDRYMRRLMQRLGHGWAAAAPYDEVQRWFVTGLPADADTYGELHALIVQHGKEHCRARPVCEGCPLHYRCETGLSASDGVTGPLQPETAPRV